ncbi:MLO-like protein 14 [Wolffia australiana]
MTEGSREPRSLASTPTWSVATVLTILVAVGLLVERSIFRLSSWLRRTHRNPLFEALDKMKEELMVLGFISLLLTATSRAISSICIDSKFYDSNFSPCTRSEASETKETEGSSSHDRKNLMAVLHNLSLERRNLNVMTGRTCGEGHEPFVSYEGLEQLHRFIFVMAVTHVTYSCLTMVLATVKIHTWRKWEDEAHGTSDGSLTVVTKALTERRQSSFVKSRLSSPWSKNGCIVWLTCFFRQFGRSVARADYLALRMGFIMNHNLTQGYDFHNYMIRSMEEEFKSIVGVSAPLWGFVVAFMLFNINGSNLYFWIALIPITLISLVGTKLQHIIATLALESAERTSGSKILNPRDELFWFNKPELLLVLIHFILFQNSFEIASFIWFWWQFGYDSCFLRNHWILYARLFLGFAGQFLCSYSTLPLYALVTQMGSQYKAALIPQRIRESIHSWGKEARRRRRKRRHGYDDTTTAPTETSTVCSIEDEDIDESAERDYIAIRLQSLAGPINASDFVETAAASMEDDPLLHAASVPSSPAVSRMTAHREIFRSSSLPPPVGRHRKPGLSRFGDRKSPLKWSSDHSHDDDMELSP